MAQHGVEGPLGQEIQTPLEEFELLRVSRATLDDKAQVPRIKQVILAVVLEPDWIAAEDAA